MKLGFDRHSDPVEVFESVDKDDGRTEDRSWLYYKLGYTFIPHMGFRLR